MKKLKMPTVQSEEAKRQATKLKGEAHSYDNARPKRPVVSRYSK